MTNSEVHALKNGIYRLFWEEGDPAVAAVGRDEEGDVWYAPTNWISVPNFNWSNIQRVELITTQEYERVWSSWQKEKPAG
jgi:hypothetical protein